MLSTTSTVVRSYGFAGIRDQNTLWTIQTAHGVQSPVARELSCRRTKEQHVMGRVVNQPLTCHSQSRNAFLCVCVCVATRLLIVIHCEVLCIQLAANLFLTLLNILVEVLYQQLVAEILPTNMPRNVFWTANLDSIVGGNSTRTVSFISTTVLS
jgi:hypothetical protein